MTSQRRGAKDEEGAGGAGGGEAGDRPQERGVPERAQGVGGRVGNGEYFMIKYEYVDTTTQIPTNNSIHPCLFLIWL